MVYHSQCKRHVIIKVYNRHANLYIIYTHTTHTHTHTHARAHRSVLKSYAVIHELNFEISVCAQLKKKNIV